jgi:glycopeptide antibiotics resistance protein
MFWFGHLYRRTPTRALYAVGFIAMGIAIEFIQGASGFRHYEVADMAANALGVLFGWGVALVLFR